MGGGYPSPTHPFFWGILQMYLNGCLYYLLRPDVIKQKRVVTISIGIRMKPSLPAWGVRGDVYSDNALTMPPAEANRCVGSLAMLCCKTKET